MNLDTLKNKDEIKAQFEEAKKSGKLFSIDSMYRTQEKILCALLGEKLFEEVMWYMYERPTHTDCSIIKIDDVEYKISDLESFFLTI